MNPDKLAPSLLVAMRDYMDQGQPVVARYRHSLGLVPATGDGPKPARTIVFIRTTPDADLGRLADLGVRLNQARGRIRTAILPLESLGEVSEAAEIRRIDPSRYVRPLMDVAAVRVHVGPFRTRTHLSGRGVVVGVVDTGIDAGHPAFAGRVLRVWDQTLHGPGVPEGGYGRELAAAAAAGATDENGHGTHVAGIAGGGETPFEGVAPGAELVVVKTTLQDAHIADGVRYIFRVAAELGRPAVVNLSLGGHGDAHDGSDALSQIIDDESGPGRIVCCAAGNEGDDSIHAQIAVRKGSIRTAAFRVPAGSGHGILSAILNGWYPGADAVEVSVQTPGGFRTPFQRTEAEGGATNRAYALPDAQVHVVTPGPDPFNGDHNFWIELHHPTSATQPVTPGTWRVRLRGLSIASGEAHIWALDNCSLCDVFFTGSTAKDSYKIGSPGAAARAVTVGAYTTRVNWTDAVGAFHEVGFELDRIASFSSEGPLRGGAEKPDVVAPGAMIAAPMARQSDVPPPYIVADGYRVDAGTSMATPFVAGLVALLLERDPSLDPEGAKALLAARAAIPRRPGGTFDRKWGRGLVDALDL